MFSQIGDIKMIRTKSEKLNVYRDESGEYYNLSANLREFQNLTVCTRAMQKAADRRART